MSHSVHIPRPTESSDISADGVVILDPATGAALFNSDACSHAYTYDGSGQMTTDTATNGALSWVKTFTWTAGKMTAESKWVPQ